MANTYNYSKYPFQELLFITKENPVLPFLVLVLLTIPMSYAINGIAVALFAFVALLTFKKSNFRLQANLIVPVILYALMALSVFWSHDVNATIKAISKVLPLFVLPICFMTIRPLSEQHKRFVLKFYSYGILFFIGFYLIRAIVRLVITHDFSVLFYHELVTTDVNAIHVSVYVAVAFFYFFAKETKSITEKAIMLVMAVFIFLLSSKNIILVFIVLMLFHELFLFRVTQKIKWIIVLLLLMLSLTVLFSNTIRDRFLIEFRSNQAEGTVNRVDEQGNKVYNVSVNQAWEKERFEQNEYFPGAAFRVYQIRIFGEMLNEDNILFSGYGLNATDFRIEEKGIEHNVFLGDGKQEGYQKKNFHNQYIQIFAETGIFGLVLLLMMLFINIKNTLKTKDFVHICFAILMISLFLTESFLARQRGVVFFATMYCLFNAIITSEASKKE